MSQPRRKPFSGSQRGLVVAFDVGTTFSGISYSVLDPGVVPEIRGVTRFPAQNPSDSSKIPSVLYYDATGVVRAIGAETQLPATIEQAENEQWIKVEWFKMHLRPNSDTSSPPFNHIPPLPPNKSLVEILADFLQYLLSCVKSFIEETVVLYGPNLWASVQNRIIYVLSHPNDWEGLQQSYMRQAAVLAGLVSDTVNDEDRIRFVTEGEASLHFCVNNGLTIGQNEGTIVLDAGGGTIDLSAYSSSRSGDAITFQEISRSECTCCFAGSIFVTGEAALYVQDKLKGTPFNDDVSAIRDIFDRTTKLQFRNSNEPSFIRFGRRSDTDLALDIRSGQMKIQGSDVARFFEPSVKAALDAIKKQRSNARKTITSVFLVGGFAASSWLLHQLKDKLQPLGLSVYRPDTHVNKAVSDGAVSFYIDHFVTTRVSRWSYGTDCFSAYDPNDPEHRRRGYSVHGVSGRLRVSDVYSVILQKDVQISEEQEFRSPYFYNTITPLNTISVDILRYEGANNNPQWVDVDAGMFCLALRIACIKRSQSSTEMYTTACTVTANVLRAFYTIHRKPGTASVYYKTEYDVILLFGLTELKAQIAWKDENVCLFGLWRIYTEHFAFIQGAEKR
ncbi:hypothetical protein BDP27DRAFT_1224514 [Rhodocollybia butyracea]|uniref:Uncharacterized protein n=1 Tax=Rhodocollybia butyracea TaxID=206335 RepID=A0A9P5PLX8_9AGAR|nr:hypothetical protein BDP27DRAFT_1224514 [Rhodocollybia butyracea]